MICKETAGHGRWAVNNCGFTRPKDAGSHWEGVPHGKLVAELIDAFRAREIEPEDLRFDLARSGADLAGGWTANHYPLSQIGILAGFGFTASNAARKVPHFYCGLVDHETEVPIVFRCVPGWRYVRGVDLKREVEEIVRQWTEEISYAGGLPGMLRREVLSQSDVSQIMMHVGRRKILPWRGIGKVDHNWQGGGDPTAWGLLKAFWSAAKRSPPQEQMQRCLMFAQIVCRGVRALQRT